MSGGACGRDDADGPTDWVSGERVFGPPGGTLDVDWLVPLLLERAPTGTGEGRATPDEALAALREVRDVLRDEAARAGVAVRDVDPDALARRLGLAGPPRDAPTRSTRPPSRPGDDLLRRAVTVVTAAAAAYDAR